VSHGHCGTHRRQHHVREDEGARPLNDPA
jgi:delta-aminolevulinic acid dehydratase/porphobilinogen synthase